MGGLAIERNSTESVEHQGTSAPIGINYLVIWPDSIRLTIDPSGIPAIANDSTTVARVGDVVSVVGGESDAGVSTDLRHRCPGVVYLGVKVSSRG